MNLNFPEIDCSAINNYCRWNKHCSQVGRKPILPFNFNFVGAEGDIHMTIDLNKMLIDGDNFGEKSGASCYIPVFWHHGSET